MLLELLQHHEELFQAVIWPLTLRRNCRSLGALAGCCRLLNVVVDNLAFYKHYKNFRSSLDDIERINILDNKYMTLREYNNKLHVNSHWSATQSFTGCETHYMWTVNNSNLQRIRKFNIVTSVFIRCYARLSITIEGVIPFWLHKYIINGYIEVNDNSDERLIFKTKN
jgi:hypothetical protein